VVGFNRELCVELAGDCFDDLADRVEEAKDECGDLVFVQLGEQADAIVLPEFLSCQCTDIGFVADDDAVVVFGKELATDSQVTLVRRSLFAVNNEATHRDQHRQLETEDHHLPGGNGPKNRPPIGPFGARLWRQMELNHRDGQTIHDTMRVPVELHPGQHHASHFIDDPHQVPSPPVPAALLRQDRKLIPMCLHMIE